MSTITPRNFRSLAEANDEDLALLVAEAERHPPDPATHMLALLRSLEHVPAKGHPVNIFEHSLQSATLALDAGEDEEMVTVALLHDIGDEIAPHDHGAFAAALLRPFIAERNVWLLEHHAPFQGYYFWHAFGGDRHARDAYRDHPHAAHTMRFVERYDAPAFDAERAPYPLSTFEPMLRAVVSRPPKRRDAVVS